MGKTFHMTLSIQYIAGLFDGEGHVSITFTTRDYRGKVYRYHRLELGITNSCLDVLQQVERTFRKGRISGRIRPHLGGEFTRQKIWEYKAGSKQACEILKILLPFLVI